MALQLHHGVVIIRFQREVAVLGITLEESSFFQESGHAVVESAGGISPPAALRTGRDTLASSGSYHRADGNQRSASR